MRAGIIESRKAGSSGPLDQVVSSPQPLARKAPHAPVTPLEVIIKVTITRTGPSNYLITWDGNNPGYQYVPKIWAFRRYDEKGTRKLSVMGNTVILEGGKELEKAFKKALAKT